MHINIKKRYLLLIGCLLLASVQAIAAPSRARSSVNNTEGDIKFGLNVGGLMGSWEVEAYGEYKLAEPISIKAALAYGKDWYLMSGNKVSNGEGSIAVLNSINLPILLRVYPGDGRQFCLFGGVQLGYAIQAELGFGEVKKGSKPDKDQLRLNMVKLKDIAEQDQVNKFQCGIVAGIDYEASFGLILGIRYSKGLISVLKSEDTLLNWTIHPTLGYNFAKLLE